MPKHDQPPSPQAFEAGWLQALAARYRRLAVEARRGGGGDAAAVLRRLAGEVAAEAEGLQVSPAAIALPAEGLDAPAHRLGGHGVWALAVGDREQLFAALSALAGTADDEATRQATEARARAQLGPLATWRLERRRAWRSEMAADTAADADAQEVQSAAELEAFDLAAEERLATELQLLAGCLQTERAPELAALLAALGGSPRGQRDGPRMPSPRSVGQAARTLLEDRFEALITIAERTSDGATQARALELAEIQLDRLRHLLPLMPALADPGDDGPAPPVPGFARDAN